MTPPPDPVAALADCEHAIIQAWRTDDGVVRLWACADCRLRFHPASLVRDSEREALVAAVKRLPLFDESDLITAMNGTVRSPRTIADHVEGYRNRVLAAIEGRP